MSKSLLSLLNVSMGKFIQLKDYSEGETIVHKNGTKTYEKDIVSNLPNEDCILITAMSIDIIFVEKENTKKHYASQGCFILTLKDDSKETVLLKYLYYCFSAFKINELLKSKRTGSLQQSISKSRLLDCLESVGLTSV